MHDSRTSWLEGVFARGDRKLGRVLERAYNAGCRFDSWEDQLKIDVWGEAFDLEGISPADYLGTIPVTARLPWDHIDVGLEEGFLLREYRKGREEPPQPAVRQGRGRHSSTRRTSRTPRRRRGSSVCYDCGVACDLSAMRTERMGYLVKLGAKTKRIPKEKPAPEVDAEGKLVRVKPPKTVQGRGPPLPVPLSQGRPHGPSSRTSISFARCRAPSGGSRSRSSTPRLPSQARHDLLAGLVARRREPRRGPRREAHRERGHGRGGARRGAHPRLAARPRVQAWSRAADARPEHRQGHRRRTLRRRLPAQGARRDRRRGAPPGRGRSASSRPPRSR